jgi:hypothetical protein
MERLCGRALLLNHGEIVAEGDPREVIEAYVASTEAACRARHRDAPEGAVVVTGLTMGALDAGTVRTGAPFRCCVSYLARAPLEGVIVRVSFSWPSGYLCTELASDPNLRLDYGPGQVEFECPMLTMQRGLYSVDVCIERRGEILERLSRAGLLRVGVGRIVQGDFYMAHSTRVRHGCNAEIDSE